jgi:hydrogenase maturation protease
MRSVGVDTGRIVVLGIGNALLGDEGLGVEAVRRLSARGLPADVELVDGGTSSLDILLSLVGEKVSRLVIVDAVSGGEAPGTIYRVDLSETGLRGDPGELSLHDLRLPDSLKMAELAGLDCDTVVLLGVEPARLEWETKLSPEVESKMDRLVELVMEEVDRC